VSARRTRVRLADFGSAVALAQPAAAAMGVAPAGVGGAGGAAGGGVVAPYLASRFYRAPEAVLGLPCSYAADWWALGCLLFELATGKVLFPGRSNNDMLRLAMQAKGAFPKRLLKRGLHSAEHFDLSDPTAPFLAREEDPVTRRPVVRRVAQPAGPQRPVGAALLAAASASAAGASAGMSGAAAAAAAAERARAAALADLLERLTALDPERRIDPDAALKHPFVTPYLVAGGGKAAAGGKAGAAPPPRK